MGRRQMNSWHPVNSERFDGEHPQAYRQRSAEIAEIVTNFRYRRYDRDSGEAMERRLMELQDPVRARALEDA